MGQSIRAGLSLVSVMMATASLIFALQGSVSRGPVVKPRDPELERQAEHHLKVARFYVKKKKWAAARTRLQEIVAHDPDFSNNAEVFFLLGKVYSKTDELDLAVELYARVAEEFPQTKFAEKARAALKKLPKRGNITQQKKHSSTGKGG